VPRHRALRRWHPDRLERGRLLAARAPGPDEARLRPRHALDFAALESGSARTMLVHAAGPVDSRAQRVRFYLYAEDLDALRSRLGENGVAAGPIVDGTPGPKREMTVRDPDGYSLVIAEID